MNDFLWGTMWLIIGTINNKGWLMIAKGEIIVVSRRKSPTIMVNQLQSMGWVTTTMIIAIRWFLKP